ncbi:hypothetical protein GDO81_007280 [Engystomops pustulosus]|uniref:Uncharacterized protein n=1 Tax=Engystomops pustulosus TaxID=76066 RepID=A0AAV7C5Y0_ENGPU|nr:hypothetical protein GDO81_007280 [Engystomops pustulosus]
MPKAKPKTSKQESHNGKKINCRFSFYIPGQVPVATFFKTTFNHLNQPQFLYSTDPSIVPITSHNHCQNFHIPTVKSVEQDCQVGGPECFWCSWYFLLLLSSEVASIKDM